MKKQISASRTILTSIVVSVSDIVLNLAITIITGSTVMLAQALQGTADLITASLLMIGVRGSKRKASASHPFGYGREIFFWTLLASIFTFLITAGVAILRGLQQIVEASPLEDMHLAFIVLSFGLVTNGYSASVSLRRLKLQAKKHKLLQYLLRSSLVETKTSLLVDLMGTSSALLGLIALGLFELTGNEIFDGVGAVAVGLLTAAGSGFLIYNLRGFIIGQSPPHETVERIRASTLGVDGVQDVLDMRAVIIGPQQVLVILEAHFADNMTTDEIETTTDQIKEAIQKDIPTVVQVQVEAETPDGELRSI